MMEKGNHCRSTTQRSLALMRGYVFKSESKSHVVLVCVRAPSEEFDNSRVVACVHLSQQVEVCERAFVFSSGNGPT